MRLAWIAILLLPVAAPAIAQGEPDGYSCSAEALTGIGGLHAVGVGEVSVTADPEYRETGSRFSYSVRDRVSGFGRFSAFWDLSGVKVDQAAIRSIWLPFHQELPQIPTAIAVSLDEGPASTIPISDRAWLQLGAGGGANGLRLAADEASAPELRGHRSFGYEIKAADGTTLFRDFILLPDWRNVPRSVGVALRRARSELKRKKCDRFYVIKVAAEDA